MEFELDEALRNNGCSVACLRFALQRRSIALQQVFPSITRHISLFGKYLLLFVSDLFALGHLMSLVSTYAGIKSGVGDS